MRIHHLNCTTMRPFAFALSGTGTPFSRSHLVVHCLLIETDGGLVLVETGFGTRDLTRLSKLVRTFTMLSGTPRDLNETAARQVVRLGHAMKDVRHIVLTHLHLDHAGGLPDFPWAKVHVHALEYEAAMHPRTFSERYYMSEQWSHGPQWVLHAPQGEQWFGFDGMRLMEEGLPEILLVPLPGHTRGHCGVAVQTGDGWLCSTAVMRTSSTEKSSRSMAVVLDRDGSSHWHAACFLTCHDCVSWSGITGTKCGCFVRMTSLSFANSRRAVARLSGSTAEEPRTIAERLRTILRHPVAKST